MLTSGTKSTDEFRNSVTGHFTCAQTVENKMHNSFPHGINKFKEENSKLNQE